jgi:hypothetical protein
MKFRVIVTMASVLMLTSACAGTEISSNVTMAEKPVSTSNAPKSKSEFCKNAALSKATIDNVFGETSATLSEEDGWNSILSTSLKMLENAPNEIEDEARDLQEGLTSLAELLAKYDYDLVAVPESELLQLDTDGKMAAASDAIDKYLEESCGIPLDS